MYKKMTKRLVKCFDLLEVVFLVESPSKQAATFRSCFTLEKQLRTYQKKLHFDDIAIQRFVQLI